MGRYYFHLQCGDTFLRDDEGRELQGIERVQAEALKAVRSIVAHDAQGGHVNLRGEIVVEDALGQQLFVLRFRDAVHLTT